MKNVVSIHELDRITPLHGHESRLHAVTDNFDGAALLRTPDGMLAFGRQQHHRHRVGSGRLTLLEHSLEIDAYRAPDFCSHQQSG